MALNKNSTFRPDDMSFMDADFDSQDKSKVSKAVKLIFAPIKGIAKGVVSRMVDENLDNLEDAKGLWSSIADEASKAGEEIKETAKDAWDATRELGERYTESARGVLSQSAYRKLKRAFETKEESYSPTPSPAQERGNEIRASITSIFSKVAAQQAQGTNALLKSAEADRAMNRAYIKYDSHVSASINDNVVAINQFLSNVYTRYLEKDIELKYKGLHIASDIKQHIDKVATAYDKNNLMEQILEAIKLPESEKANTARANSPERGRGLEAWKKNLPKELVGNIAQYPQMALTAVQMAAMALGMNAPQDMPGILEAVGKIVGKYYPEKWLPKFLKGGLVKKVYDRSKDYLGVLNDDLGHITKNYPLLINGLARKASNSTGFLGQLASMILPEFSRDLSTENKTANDPTGAATFDNITRETIISTIPRHLERIGDHIEALTRSLEIGPITDKEAKTYDVTTHRLITREQLNRKNSDFIYGTKAEREANANETINVIATNLEVAGASKEIKKKFKDSIDLIQMFFNRSADKQIPVDPLALQDFYANGEKADENTLSYIQDVFGTKGAEAQKAAEVLFTSMMTKDSKGRTYRNNDLMRSILTRISKLGSAIDVQEERRQAILQRGYFDEKDYKFDEYGEATPEVKRRYAEMMGKVNFDDLMDDTYSRQSDIDKLNKKKTRFESFRESFENPEDVKWLDAATSPGFNSPALLGGRGFGAFRWLADKATKLPWIHSEAISKAISTITDPFTELSNTIFFRKIWYDASSNTFVVKYKKGDKLDTINITLPMNDIKISEIHMDQDGWKLKPSPELEKLVKKIEEYFKKEPNLKKNGIVDKDTKFRTFYNLSFFGMFGTDDEDFDDDKSDKGPSEDGGGSGLGWFPDKKGIPGINNGEVSYTSHKKKASTSDEHKKPLIILIQEDVRALREKLVGPVPKEKKSYTYTYTAPALNLPAGLIKKKEEEKKEAKPGVAYSGNEQPSAGLDHISADDDLYTDLEDFEEEAKVSFWGKLKNKAKEVRGKVNPNSRLGRLLSGAEKKTDNLKKKYIDRKEDLTDKDLEYLVENTVLKGRMTAQELKDQGWNNYTMLEVFAEQYIRPTDDRHFDQFMEVLNSLTDKKLVKFGKGGLKRLKSAREAVKDKSLTWTKGAKEGIINTYHSFHKKGESDLLSLSGEDFEKAMNEAVDKEKFYKVNGALVQYKDNPEAYMIDRTSGLPQVKTNASSNIGTQAEASKKQGILNRTFNKITGFFTLMKKKKKSPEQVAKEALRNGATPAEAQQIYLQAKQVEQNEQIAKNTKDAAENADGGSGLADALDFTKSNKVFKNAKFLRKHKWARKLVKLKPSRLLSKSLPRALKGSKFVKMLPGVGGNAILAPLAAAAALGGMGLAGSRASGASKTSSAFSALTGAGAGALLAANMTNPVGWALAAGMAANSMREGWNDKKTLKNSWNSELTATDSQKGSSAVGNLLNYASFGLLNKLGGRKYVDKALQYTNLGQAVGGIGGMIAGTGDLFRAGSRGALGKAAPMTELELKRARAKLQTDVKRGKPNAQNILQAFEKAVSEKDWPAARDLSGIMVNEARERSDAWKRIGKGFLRTIPGVGLMMDAYDQNTPMTPKELAEAEKRFKARIKKDPSVKSAYLDFQEAVAGERWAVARKLSGVEHMNWLNKKFGKNATWAAAATLGISLLFQNNENEPMTEKEIQKFQKQCQDLLAKNPDNQQVKQILEQFNEAVELGKWRIARKLAGKETKSIMSKLISNKRSTLAALSLLSGPAGIIGLTAAAFMTDQSTPMDPKDIEAFRKKMEYRKSKGDSSAQAILDRFDTAVLQNNWVLARKISKVKHTSIAEKTGKFLVDWLFWGDDTKPMTQEEIDKFRASCERKLKMNPDDQATKKILEKFDDAVGNQKWKLARQIAGVKQTSLAGVIGKTSKWFWHDLWVGSEDSAFSEDEANKFRERMRKLIDQGNPQAKQMLDEFEDAMADGNWSRARRIMGRKDLGLYGNLFRWMRSDDHVVELDEKYKDSGKYAKTYRYLLSKVKEDLGNPRFKHAWSDLADLRDDMQKVDFLELDDSLLGQFQGRLSAIDRLAAIFDDQDVERYDILYNEKTKLLERKQALLSEIAAAQERAGIFEWSKRDELKRMFREVEGIAIEDLEDDVLDQYDKRLRILDKKALTTMKYDPELQKTVTENLKRTNILMNEISRSRMRTSWWEFSKRSALTKLEESIEGVPIEERTDAHFRHWDTMMKTIDDTAMSSEISDPASEEEARQQQQDEAHNARRHSAMLQSARDLYSRVSWAAQPSDKRRLGNFISEMEGTPGSMITRMIDDWDDTWDELQDDITNDRFYLGSWTIRNSKELAAEEERILKLNKARRKVKPIITALIEKIQKNYRPSDKPFLDWLKGRLEYVETADSAGEKAVLGIPEQIKKKIDEFYVNDPDRKRELQGIAESKEIEAQSLENRAKSRADRLKAEQSMAAKIAGSTSAQANEKLLKLVNVIENDGVYTVNGNTFDISRLRVQDRDTQLAVAYHHVSKELSVTDPVKRAARYKKLSELQGKIAGYINNGNYQDTFYKNNNCTIHDLEEEIKKFDIFPYSKLPPTNTGTNGEYVYKGDEELTTLEIQNLGGKKIYDGRARKLSDSELKQLREERYYEAHDKFKEANYGVNTDQSRIVQIPEPTDDASKRAAAASIVKSVSWLTPNWSNKVANELTAGSDESVSVQKEGNAILEDMARSSQEGNDQICEKLDKLVNVMEANNKRLVGVQGAVLGQNAFVDEKILASAEQSYIAAVQYAKRHNGQNNGKPPVFGEPVVNIEK